MKPALLLSLTCALTYGSVTRIAFVEGITEYKLDNGLRLLVVPDPTKPNLTVNITYLVGSRHEGPGEGGMAHLLEHMVFKGSPRHLNIPQELTEHGARPNGSTTWDRTNYFETFPASDENLRWAIDLESDRMVNSFIRKADLDKEFTVVRNELERGQNDPFNVLFLHTMSAAYLWHGYGRAVVGNRSDIEQVRIDQLQQFYRKFYQPDNAVLTVAGKVDEPSLLKLVDEYFGKIPMPARALTPTTTVEPAQDGERLTTVRRAGAVRAVSVLYHVPDGAHPDFAALEVLVSILSENGSGRLHKALVETRKASGIFGNALQLAEPGVIGFGATLPKTDSPSAARDEMVATIEGIVKQPPSQEEVDRARIHLLKDFDLSMRNSERIGLFMSEYAALGDWRTMFLERDGIRKVTTADVARVASAYLKESNRTLGEFIPDPKPDRAEIPPRTDALALVKDYKGDAEVAAGEAFDPSPAAIESRIQRFVLPSGMKVTLLPKKTRGASVHASISLHFGDVESLKGFEGAAELAAGILVKGTEKHNRQQLQDEIDRLQAQLQVSGSATGAEVRMESNRENLQSVMRLAAEILQNATLPENEFEQARRQNITQLETGKSDPQALALNALSRTLYPFPKGDVRATPPPEESIERLASAKYQDAKTFYHRFYGASQAELAIVGDFDILATKGLVTRLFGDWKSGTSFARLSAGTEPLASVNQSIETPDKASAVFLAGERLRLSDADPDFAALVFGNYLLGGGYLNSRLAQRIRTREGLSYSVASSLIAKSFEHDGRIQVMAIAAPQNIDRVEAAFHEEIARMLKDGFTDREVEAGRTGWLQSRQLTRASDPSLCAILASRSFDNRTLQWDLDLEAKVRSLTAAQLNETLRRYIDPGQFSIVKAGSFAKSTPPASN
jgi:zinc protease